MRLIKDVTRDDLPYHVNLTIRCEKNQEKELERLMEMINPIDVAKDYEIIVRPKGMEDVEPEDRSHTDTDRRGKLHKDQEPQGTTAVSDSSKEEPAEQPKTKRKRRSRNANGYYRQLASKVAPKMGMTDTQYHNINLAKLGIPWVDSAGQRDWILRKDNSEWQYFEKQHYCPTNQTEVRNGMTYRWFYRLQSSKEFDQNAMSRLIDLAVKDAVQLGVETLTPAELEQIQQAGYR